MRLKDMAINGLIVGNVAEKTKGTPKSVYEN